MFPLGLQGLVIKEGLITTKGASKLPKSLTYLRTHLKVFANNESMSYLRHISELDLSTPNTPYGELNENWLSSLLLSSFPTPNHDCVSGCTNICDYSNYDLTSLTLYGRLPGGYMLKSIIPHVQKPLFDSLQKFKNLNTLSITYCAGISGDWFYLVPQTVTNLDLTLRAFPTANQLSILPTCLKYLGVGAGHDAECYWTDEILQSLPRSLLKLSIHAREFPNLTHRMYEYLPPNLQSATLRYKAVDKLVYFIPPLDRQYGPKPSIE